MMILKKNLPHNSTTASDAQTCVRFGNRYALGRLPYAAGRQSRRIVRSVLLLIFGLPAGEIQVRLRF